jgi:hypothetical protein
MLRFRPAPDFPLVSRRGAAGLTAQRLAISLLAATAALITTAPAQAQTGSTTSLSVMYVDPITGNVIPVSNNGTIPFPNTVVNTNVTVAVEINNNGTGTGMFNSAGISPSSSGFQLVGLPAFPLSIGPSLQTSFGIKFSPTQAQAYSGTLTLNLNGQTTTINLTGTGAQTQFSYTWTAAGTTTSVTPGGTIVVPATAVGQTTSVTISVTNTFATSGQITSLGVTAGQGLSFSNVPALPLTLAPNAPQPLTLNFAPTQPGAVTAQLTIGNDSFTVTATGLGSQLSYSYTSGTSTVSVSPGGLVIFPPLAVGSSESLTFSIQNTGTAAATISSIDLPAPSTPFSLSQVSSLPINLAAGGTTTFTISFSPSNTGDVTATLEINGGGFTLSGNGTEPAALPSYQFQGASGNQAPDQQPSIGLTLASAYSLPLQGTLTLTFVPAAFADDSTIQFASGGLTVNFTIPANSTQALFSGGATTVGLQTGTTAGSIVITPAFSLQNGFNVTPSSPPVLTLTILSAAPQLLSANVSDQTTNGFTLIVSGYSTDRVLQQFQVQFTPVQGQTLSASQVTINVSSIAEQWFQSTVSDNYGGSFLVAIPFTLSSGNSSANLIQLVQSLSVTATNDIGTSSALSVPLQ